jgi:hypothetical protein
MNIEIHKKNPKTGEVFEKVCFIDGNNVIHELVEDKTKDSIKITDFELVSFLEDGEKYITGEEMVRRTKDYALGKEDGEWLLENQDKIPEEWRDYYIVFPLWRRPGGSGYVFYVCWYGGQWVRGWYWLGSHWYGGTRVLRRKIIKE